MALTCELSNSWECQNKKGAFLGLLHAGGVRVTLLSTQPCAYVW